MFQTVHDYSGFHAAARCVSGGPIYVTDVPGQHDLDLIGQMTGPTPLGKTVIFRPSVIGRALDHTMDMTMMHCFLWAHIMVCNPNLLHCPCSYDTGAAEVGTGIIGIFNVSQRQLSEMIPLF